MTFTLSGGKSSYISIHTTIKSQEQKAGGEVTSSDKYENCFMEDSNDFISPSRKFLRFSFLGFEMALVSEERGLS